MLTNAFGNLCNYLTFTTLLSLHHKMFSNHTSAVTVGALVARVFNYTVTRFVVFRVMAPKHIAGSASASTSAVVPTSV